MENYRSEYKKLGDDFFKKKFRVPIYQRLYVWENIQVKTLIDDLVRAYEHDAKQEYYLGGIVVVKNEDILDLIDGQQRFTTLKILRELLGETELKLDFVVRNDVWTHFQSMNESDDADINRMKEAKEELIAGLKKRVNKDDKEFLTYLQEQVKLVVTIVPSQSDLNKLFELINGRGEQLQQHEILKAKLLSRIKENKYKYGKIWDICSKMDDFLEINIKKSFGEKWSNHKFNQDFSSLFESIKKDEEIQTDQQIIKIQPTISNIINTKNNISKEKIFNELDSDLEDEDSTQYLSIISFEMFLLYALVSFENINYFEKMKMQKNAPEFKDKNLIQIFEIVLLNNIEEENDNLFGEFIKHLFNSRVKFDNFVIKNHKVLDDNSNVTNHKISKVKIDKNGKYFSRKIHDIEDSRDLALLQSMLYHSHTRNTQEWIIPFISNINNDSSVYEAIKLLKNIDNVLYSQIGIEDTVLLRAAKYDNDKETIIDCNKIVDYLKKKPEEKNLKENDYHHISHYWFYKMDWIIWDLSDKKDKEFKFTARNSIEHIGPQNSDDENIIVDKVYSLKHSFGNLFLVSVSQNSSLGNSGFNTKKAMFKDKNVKNLKLGLLSEYSNWGDSGVKQHLDECIVKVKKYFKCNDYNYDCTSTGGLEYA